tara:strand:- start:3437 stop:3661 length:225 start_codon:yes stop_codon:yes gene_type:complete
MSNRRQLSLEVAQMGKVWVASFTLLGISAIGATESAAINAVLDAFKTHNLEKNIPEEKKPKNFSINSEAQLLTE